MSFPRHSKYKESGVDWLGPIPQHWNVDRLKNALAIKKRVVGDRSSEYTLLSLTLQGVIPRDLDNPQGKFPTDFDTYQEVENNDLVFCLFDVEETPRAVGLSQYEGMVTGAYTVASAKSNYAPAFLYYYYLARDQYKAWKMFYTGLRNVIRTDTFGNIPCLLPPLDEQEKIYKFLDGECAKIESLITEQEKLIALLKEKRQAVISHAVTKGLDPNVQMKDSGIEWLGEVPAHWAIKRMSWLFSLIASGTTPASDSDKYYGGEICWVTTGELRETLVTDTEKKVTHEALEDHSALRIYPIGTLLIALYGATIGRLGFLGVEAATNQACCAMAHPIGTVPRFAFYALLAAREYLMLIASGGGQPNINQEKIRSLRVAIPSKKEQESIIKFLDHEIEKIQLLISEAEQAISLLSERRSALISAAVTGKIDVRQLAEAEVA